MNKSFFKRSSFLIAFSVCIMFIFTSCIDSIQTVNLDGDNVDSYYKIAVSKKILETGEITEQEFFDNFKDLSSVLPSGSEINEIKNDTDIGIEFRVSVNQNDFNEINNNFIPYAGSSNEIYIPFLLGMCADVFENIVISADEGGLGEAVLVSLDASKCRLMLSKYAVPYMETSFFMTTGEEKSYYEVPFYDYGEYYCIEIPLSLLAFGRTLGLDLSQVIVY